MMALTFHVKMCICVCSLKISVDTNRYIVQFFSYFSVLAIRFFISLKKEKRQKQKTDFSITFILKVRWEWAEIKVFCINWVYHVSFLKQELWIGNRVGAAHLPPMCPGFDSWTRRHMWAEFVGSLLCSERFFSGNSAFPLSSKTNIWFDLIDLIYSLPN